LARSREVLGEDHPSTLAAAASLAATLRSTGDYAGARTLEERVLARSRVVLGEDHPLTTAVRNALAEFERD
jgi:hypothetical protein